MKARDVIGKGLRRVYAALTAASSGVAPFVFGLPSKLQDQDGVRRKIDRYDKPDLGQNVDCHVPKQ
jgi:hypothetical protein